MKNIDQLQYIYLNIIRFLSMMKRGEKDIRNGRMSLIQNQDFRGTINRICREILASWIFAWKNQELLKPNWPNNSASMVFAIITTGLQAEN